MANVEERTTGQNGAPQPTVAEVLAEIARLTSLAEPPAAAPLPDYPTLLGAEAALRARRQNREVRFRTPEGFLMLAHPDRGLEVLRER